jgi:hypothetical protein
MLAIRLIRRFHDLVRLIRRRSPVQPAALNRSAGAGENGWHVTVAYIVGFFILLGTWVGLRSERSDMQNQKFCCADSRNGEQLTMRKGQIFKTAGKFPEAGKEPVILPTWMLSCSTLNTPSS